MKPCADRRAVETDGAFTDEAVEAWGVAGAVRWAGRRRGVPPRVAVASPRRRVRARRRGGRAVRIFGVVNGFSIVSSRVVAGCAAGAGWENGRRRTGRRREERPDKGRGRAGRTNRGEPVGARGADILGGRATGAGCCGCRDGVSTAGTISRSVDHRQIQDMNLGRVKNSHPNDGAFPAAPCGPRKRSVRRASGRGGTAPDAFDGPQTDQPVDRLEVGERRWRARIIQGTSPRRAMRTKRTCSPRSVPGRCRSTRRITTTPARPHRPNLLPAASVADPGTAGDRRAGGATATRADGPMRWPTRRGRGEECPKCRPAARDRTHCLECAMP